MNYLTQPYNIAGKEIKTIEEVIQLSHFLITKHSEPKQEIQDSINEQFDGKNPIESLLLFSANFDSYKPNEKDKILGELIKDLRNYPKS